MMGNWIMRKNVLAGLTIIAVATGCGSMAQAQDASADTGKPRLASAKSEGKAANGAPLSSPNARVAIKEPVTQAGCRAAMRPGKPYFIEFRSRTAQSYGHTFVFYGRLGGGNRFANFKVAGLHPAGDDPGTYMQGHLAPVPAETGVSYGDLDEQYLTARFCVTLTEAEFNKAAAYIRKLQAEQKTWHAMTYNCNSFASDIAKFIGLDSPNPNMYMPDKFIGRLADLNGGAAATTAAGM